MKYRYSRDPQVDRSLRYSLRDGIAWSLMFGAGESYLQAFAVFLKATTAQITALAALPALFPPSMDTRNRAPGQPMNGPFGFTGMP